MRRSGPARILFLTANTFGTKTVAEHRQRHAAKRDDVDAVTLYLQNSFPMKVASKPIRALKGLDLAPVRRRRVWESVLWKWFNGPLDLRRFDVVLSDTSTFANAQTRWARQRPDHPIVRSIMTDIISTVHHRLTEPTDQPARPLNWANRKLIAYDAPNWEGLGLAVAWSQWLSDAIVRDTPATAEQMMVLPPPVVIPPRELIEQQRAERAKAIAEGDLVKIIFVGQDFKRKGGERLVRWHQEHFADRAELHIISGWAPPITGKNLVMHGSVPNDKVVGELVPGSDLMVIPTFHDTCLVVLGEAGAAGVPAISSHMAGVPEMLPHGITCPFDDESAFVTAMRNLIDNAEERTTLGMKSRDAAEQRLDSETTFDPLYDRLVALADQLPASG